MRRLDINDVKSTHIITARLQTVTCVVLYKVVFPFQVPGRVPVFSCILHFMPPVHDASNSDPTYYTSYYMLDIIRYT